MSRAADAGEGDRPGRELTELALGKVELVAALAELEAGHEAGRIPEKDYRHLRQEKRKALRSVLAQLEGDTGTASASSSTSSLDPSPRVPSP